MSVINDGIKAKNLIIMNVTIDKIVMMKMLTEELILFTNWLFRKLSRIVA